MVFVPSYQTVYYFSWRCIVAIPKPKECSSKSLTCDDFTAIAISPILSKVTLNIVAYS